MKRDPLATAAIVIVGEGRARMVAEFPRVEDAARFAQLHINAGKRVVFADRVLVTEAT